MSAKCPNCKHPLSGISWKCANCKFVTSPCSLWYDPWTGERRGLSTNRRCGWWGLCLRSHQTVKGLFAWCQGCGHGGHLRHLQDWFSRHTRCPAGCDHVCDISGVTVPREYDTALPDSASVADSHAVEA